MPTHYSPKFHTTEPVAKTTLQNPVVLLGSEGLTAAILFLNPPTPCEHNLFQLFPTESTFGRKTACSETP